MGICRDDRGRAPHEGSAAGAGDRRRGQRGTIYGIYDLSEQIGVSPWYWWADVRVPHADALVRQPGRYVQPGRR